MVCGHRKQLLVSLFITLLGLSIQTSTFNPDTSSRYQEKNIKVNETHEHDLDRVESSSASSVAIGQNSSYFHIQVAAIHVDKSEFPLSKLLFKLTLRLALESVEKRLSQQRVKLSVSVRSATTCSRQYAGAVAADEYYTKRARLFIVSGCDDAIRAVSRLASRWQVPVMTAAGFGLDLSDKSIHRTLIRVAFSLKAAVEFLFKIMKSFQWRRFNLIVDESDSNCQALRGSIEKQLSFIKTLDSRNDTSEQLSVNTISLDIQTLITMDLGTDSNSTDGGGGSSVFGLAGKRGSNGAAIDRWPNEITEQAIRDALEQSSLYSRVNVLLLPQIHLRKFMLSVYDSNMANGMYTFINMPLLSITSEDQVDNTAASSAAKFSKQSYTTSFGENVFVWRSLSSSRNAHAKQAFESLMSIYLKSPTTKAYVYFASKLSNLANTEYATTTTTQSSLALAGKVPLVPPATKTQLSINPYSASFYDCLQIYAIALEESLKSIRKETNAMAKRSLKSRLHASIIDLVRNRRFENLLTGSIVINHNGDRETDYTLDDMNQITGKFNPVIWYRGDTKEMERLSRIQWSSDLSVGPTVDNVDCNLTGTCPSKPFSRFMVTLVLLAAPLIMITGFVLYFVHNRIHLESQLVDYWWRIDIRDIEIIASRRKNLGGGASIGTVEICGSQTESVQRAITDASNQSDKGTEVGLYKAKNDTTIQDSAVGQRTTITKVTDTSAFNSSAPDVCYGSIVLGIYKLNKVALKPISKFRQTRKMMMEIRGVSSKSPSLTSPV